MRIAPRIEASFVGCPSPACVPSQRPTGPSKDSAPVARSPKVTRVCTAYVGRILNFDGIAILRGGNDTLREVSERFGDREVAYHARVALAAPLAWDYKVVDMDDRMGEMASAKKLEGASAEPRLALRRRIRAPCSRRKSKPSPPWGGPTMNIISAGSEPRSWSMERC